MNFSSRQLLLIAVTFGCVLAVAAYFTPYDPRSPWMNELVEQLTSGPVTAVWLLPGCLLGLLGDLPAAAWFGGCLVTWLSGAWRVWYYEFHLGISRPLINRDGLVGWPVALLFVFYIVFFAVRRMDRDLDHRRESRRM